MTRDASAGGALVTPLMTKREVADHLCVSERTVDRFVVAGKLVAYRVGGHRRFLVEDVEALVRASRVRP